MVEMRKNMDQKNSVYGHFSSSVWIDSKIKFEAQKNMDLKT